MKRLLTCSLLFIQINELLSSNLAEPFLPFRLRGIAVKEKLVLQGKKEIKIVIHGRGEISPTVTKQSYRKRERIKTDILNLIIFTGVLKEFILHCIQHQ